MAQEKSIANLLFFLNGMLMYYLVIVLPLWNISRKWAILRKNVLERLIALILIRYLLILRKSGQQFRSQLTAARDRVGSTLLVGHCGVRIDAKKIERGRQNVFRRDWIV